MNGYSWLKTASLLAVVAFTLAACEQVKPIVPFESALTLSAPGNEVLDGQTFTLVVKLSYQDQDGVEQPLANQPISLEGEGLAVPAQVVTGPDGEASLEVTAVELPERVRETDGWVRARFGGAVIEFATLVGRFSDTRNARYFKIKQSSPGLNPPGLIGSER